MPKSPQEEGDKDRFSMRVGVEAVSRLKGMNRQVDAGAIPDDQFYHLENSRIVGSPGGGVRPRFGQLRSSSVDDGDVVGLFDASDIGAPTEEAGIGVSFECATGVPGEIVAQRLYAIGNGTIAMYDPVNGSRQTAAGDGTLQPLNIAGLIKDEAASRILAVDTYAVWALGPNSAVPSKVFVPDFPVGYSGNPGVASIAQLGIEYFIGRLLHAAGDYSDIVVWDGVARGGPGSLELVRTAPLNDLGFPVVFTHGGEVYSGVVGSAAITTLNAFYKRTAGVWAPITVPVSPFGLVSWASFASGDGYLYLAGGRYILKWNGVTVTTFKDFGAGAVVYSLLDLDGYLYYSYKDPASAFWIGRWDGAVAQDTYKSQVGTVVSIFDGSFLGETYMTMFGASPGLYHTTANNLAGALTKVSNCFVGPSLGYNGPGAVL